MDAGGERREPTATLGGWRQFVDAAPAGFDLLPEPARAGLTSAKRAAYDEARISYHSELVVVATSTLRFAQRFRQSGVSFVRVLGAPRGHGSEERSPLRPGG
jgi:hypothetical protein